MSVVSLSTHWHFSLFLSLCLIVAPLRRSVHFGMVRRRAAKEAERHATEEGVSNSFKSSANWTHPGAWSHHVFMSEDNVRLHNESKWSYAELPSWSCCKADREDSRGCQRIA